MIRTKYFTNTAILALVCLFATPSWALDFTAMVLKTAGFAIAKEGKKRISAMDTADSTTVAATGAIEVAFSPREGAEALVLKVIHTAKTDIRLMGYSFTSAPITQALLEAKHRGVDIKMVVDYKNNVSEDRSGKARAALSALTNAGVDVRTIDAYDIAHDKVIVSGSETTLTGSFNFSAAAASRNSENVLVNWQNPALAKVYLAHFERNYRQSVPYKPRY